MGCYVSGLAVKGPPYVADGADIIDLGGESTWLDTLVSEEEELARVMPVLKRLVNEPRSPFPLTPPRPGGQAGSETGAHIVNDQRPAGRPRHGRCGCGIRRTCGLDAQPVSYRFDQIPEYFRESIRLAEQAGVVREKLIIDPGFGFGKTPQQNLELLRRLKDLRCLGLPVLIGSSRKSTIGKVLGGLPVDQRLEGTAATVAVAIVNGAAIVRVHDVREIRQDDGRHHVK